MMTTRGQKGRQTENPENPVPIPVEEGAMGLPVEGNNRLEEWSRLTNEFHSKFQEALRILSAPERSAAPPLIVYFDNILGLLKEWLSEHAQVFSQSDRVLQGEYMQSLTRVLDTLRPSLKKLKEKGQSSELFFTVLDYRPYSAMLAELNSVAALTVQDEGDLASAQSFRSPRNNYAPRRTRRNRRGQNRDGSMHSAHSRTRNNEFRDYESPELLAELRRYSELPPPWNKEPTQSVRLERLDISRLVQTAGEKTFSGKVEDYMGWRDFFLGTIGDVRCAARHKVNALRKALEPVMHIIIDFVPGDFKGYSEIIKALEKSYGGMFRQMERYDEYFDRTDKFHYGELHEYREYCRMVAGYKALLEQSSQADLFESTHIYRRLLLPLPSAHIRELQTWLHSSGRFESAGNLYRWTQDRLQRMLTEKEVDRRKNKVRSNPPSRPTAPVSAKMMVTELQSFESEPEEYQECREEIFYSDEEVEDNNASIQYIKIKMPDICLFGCDEKHLLEECERFLHMSPINRRDLIKTWKLVVCYSCLKIGHGSRHCRSKNKCSICSSTSHHTLLHLDNINKVSLPIFTASLPRGLRSPSVLLPFLPVKISRGENFPINVLAMVDTGSNVSVIASNLGKRMFPTKRFYQIKVATAGGTVLRKVAYAHIFIQSLESQKRYDIPIIYFDLEELFNTISIPNVSDLVKQYPHLKMIPIHNLVNYPIALLLGNDNASLTAPLEVQRGPLFDDPIAESSLLGWTIRGPIKRIHDEFQPSIASIETINEEEEPVEELLKRIELSWDLPEHLQKTYLTNSDKMANDIISATLKLTDNELQAGILWKNGTPPIIPNNKPVAIKRLKALHRQLKKKPEIKKLYEENINTWIQEEVLVKAERAEEGRIHYLCHFPVVNMSKSTTKVRTVVDAAARYKGCSLNDFILPGPNLANDIRRVLIRFRRDSVAITADIRSMFTQIKLLTNERSYHRILWSKAENDPITEYNFTCFTFGNSCSPAIAVSAARYLADLAPNECQRAKETIYHSTIVDDALDSVSTVEEATTLLKQLQQIYSKGSMSLHKIGSNSSEVIGSFPDNEIAQEIKLAFESQLGTSTKALGIKWVPNEDIITFYLSLDTNPKSKRKMLSTLAKVYDPLGLISPLLVEPKVIVQKTWLLQSAWDAQLPKEVIAEWNSAVRAIEGEVVIPRPLVHPDKKINQEIHIFVDASEKAYGAVAFLTTRYEKYETSVSLICSRSKVAPLKQVSIPRLELQAAVEGAEMLEGLLEALSLSPANAYFYTDSYDVLFWIRSASRNLKVFVSNRVGLIQRCTWISHWDWVPTEVNPADLLTRQNSYIKLKESMWFSGPIFLKDISARPKIKIPPPSITAKRECRQKIKICTNIVLENKPWMTRLKRFSSWESFIRAIARLQRKCSQQGQKPPLSAKELRTAFNKVIHLLQYEVWQKEIDILQKGGQLQCGNDIYIYKPFINEKTKVMHASGRISYAEHLPYLTRFPIIILEKSHWATIIIRDIHISEMKHTGGLKSLIAKVRESFLIPKLQVTAKRILRSCIHCRKHVFKSRIPDWAPLPSHRIPASKRTPPFYTSAADFFGPLYVDTREINLEENTPPQKKPGRPSNKLKQIIRTKVYVLVITCTLYRAVHLEMTEYLSADSLLLALDRFIAMRGRPNQIISDNGKNFVGASTLLKSTFEKFQQRVPNKYPKIQWTFTTPFDPHKNGIVERMVGLSKDYLAKLTLNKKLTMEELRTALKMVEAALNQRPLQSADENVTDQEPLTPNHFLRGSDYNTLMITSNIPDNMEAWKKTNEFLEMFWKRFTQQIVPEMNILSKKFSRNIIYKEGQIVLIQEPTDTEINFPAYPIAKIIEIYKCKDGIIRSVKLRFKGKDIVRGVSKIAPLFL